MLIILLVVAFALLIILKDQIIEAMRGREISSNKFKKDNDRNKGSKNATDISLVPF